MHNRPLQPASTGVLTCPQGARDSQKAAIISIPSFQLHENATFCNILTKTWQGGDLIEKKSAETVLLLLM